jgi:hypothetical protein
MSMTFRFLSLLACVAATACVIQDDDDDGGASNTATASNTNNTASASDSTASATASESDSGGSTAAGSSGAADSSSSGTGGASGCGWGPLPGQNNVDEGYTCGGDGDDPKGVFPIACPEGVMLVDSGDCGGDMGVTGVGCCDGNTNWYCADNGSGPQLFRDPCD